MRPDFGKVLTERPRAGGHYDVKTRRRKQRERDDLESAPKVAPLRDRDARTKSFSDLIGPMRRFLRKNVGRPWDKVRAEAIAAIGGSGGTLQRHLFQHLDGYVHQHVQMVNGVPCSPRSYGGLQPIYNSYRGAMTLYVHPKTGALALAKKLKDEKPERFEVHRTGEFSSAMWFRGCWYDVTLKAFPFMQPTVRDAYFERDVDPVECEKLWGHPSGRDGSLRVQYCASLRAMRKEEIRNLPFTPSRR